MIDAATGAYVRRSEPFVPQQNLFEEPTDSGIVVAPGPAGGANWWPSSYSPTTDLFYVVGLHMPFKVTRAEKEAQKGEAWLGGEYSPASKDVYSTLSAIVRRPAASSGSVASRRSAAARSRPREDSSSPARATAGSARTTHAPASRCGASSAAPA